MPNKLKDVFSNKMFKMGGNLRFRDQTAYNKFLEALDIVLDEGQTLEVEGVSAINAHVKDGEMIYPLMVESGPTELVIRPSVKSVPITVDTACGKKTIELKQYQIKNGVVLETIEDAILFLKFVFGTGEYQGQFTYRRQMQFAKRVKDVMESYYIAINILNLLKPDNEQNISDNMDSFHMIKNTFQMEYSFWKKLSLIEDELAISFSPEKIDNIEEIIQDVEELYLLLIKKEAVRMNQTPISTDITEIKWASKEQNIEIGQVIDLIFTGEISYSICEQSITIYTANLISNAKIKEISETETGAVRILYSDTDSKPMYISCTGHKTPNEAKTESELMMRDKGHNQKYREALTLNEYYKRKSGN